MLCWNTTEAKASVITVIDDFDTGSISVSSASSVSDGQVESSLPLASVIKGVRATDIHATAAIPTTVANSSGQAEITFPTGSVLSTSNINFVYNAGQNTFPSSALSLDLSNMVAFRVDISSPTNIFGFQLRIFDSNGNSKVATKNVFANTSGTFSFLPTDFTGGSVYSTVQSIQLTLGGISSFNLLPGSNIATVDNFVLETVPEPGTASLLLLGLASGFVSISRLRFATSHL